MNTAGGDSRGRRGFGHSQDRRSIVPVEAQLIRDAAKRVLQGETLVAVIEDWNRRGIRTTAGGPWRINALSALLIQPRLAGLDSAKERGRDGGPPPILDKATHDRLVALRKARAKQPIHARQNQTDRRYLLTGLLRCWRCNSRLHGTPRLGSAARPYYRCPSRGGGGCSGTMIQMAPADDAARDAVLARVDHPEFAALVHCREMRLAHEARAVAALVADALTSRHPSGETRLVWGNGRINGHVWRELKIRLEKQAKAAESELGRQALLARQQQLCGSGALLRASWDDMDVQKRRSVLEALVEYFVVSPRRPGSRLESERLRAVWHA